MTGGAAQRGATGLAPAGNGDTYGLPGENSVVGALTRLAGERALGVSGAVIPVEALAQSQYTAWDANPCDNDAANAVANAIANQIATLKASHASLKYVVFVGGDDQVPFFRVPDLSRIANESGFADSFASTTMTTCAGGGRGGRAAEALTAAGHAARSIEGGTRAWEALGLPVESTLS